MTQGKQPKKKPKAKQRSAEYLKYQKYIRSKEFKKVKEAVFERDGHKCAVCGWSDEERDPDMKSTNRSLSCHHITYRHLFYEMDHLEDCITLCNVCHCAIHKSKSNIHRFKKSLSRTR